MVLERSFDSADLKRMLLDSEMVVDRSLFVSSGRPDPTRINRPPLPKGSSIFEKVLDEFQPERQGPEIRLTGATTRPAPHQHTHQDPHHLSPFTGRSRSNSRSEPQRPRPKSPKGRSPSQPSGDKTSGVYASGSFLQASQHRPRLP